MTKLAIKKPERTLYFHVVLYWEDTKVMRDDRTHFNDTLDVEKLNYGITSQQENGTSMQYDLKETIDDLWNVVKENIINTGTASMETANVHHQTNLECRDMLHDQVLLTDFCSCFNRAEAVCSSESADPKSLLEHVYLIQLRSRRISFKIFQTHQMGIWTAGWKSYNQNYLEIRCSYPQCVVSIQSPR